MRNRFGIATLSCVFPSCEGVDFKRDILPKLQSVPVRAIAELFGCEHLARLEGAQRA